MRSALIGLSFGVSFLSLVGCSSSRLIKSGDVNTTEGEATPTNDGSGYTWGSATESGADTSSDTTSTDTDPSTDTANTWGQDTGTATSTDPIVAQFCIVPYIHSTDGLESGAYSLWWADVTAGEEDYDSSHWALSTTNVSTTDGVTDCVTDSDFHPGHDYFLNGAQWSASQNKWLYLADNGNIVRVSLAGVFFADGSYDEYEVDSTSSKLGQTGYIVYKAHSDGSSGGNLDMITQSDVIGSD